MEMGQQDENKRDYFLLERYLGYIYTVPLVMQKIKINKYRNKK